MVLGQFKTCVVLLGGYLIFGSDPGFVSICGAVVALCGMSVYTSLNLSHLQDASSSLSPSSTKPKANTEGAEQLDLNKNSNVV